MDFRLLLDKMKLNENQTNKIGLAKQQELRECAHIFTETCLQAVATYGWSVPSQQTQDKERWTLYLCH